MNREQLLKDLRLEPGDKLPAFAWPGGYPIFYLAGDNEVICPDCANGENGSECLNPECQDDKQWQIVGQGVHWEGMPLTCSHCNEEIESAYGMLELERNRYQSFADHL